MTSFADLKTVTSDRISYKVFQLNGDRYLVVTRNGDVETVEGYYSPPEADAKLDELLGSAGHTDCQEWREDVVFKTFANVDADSPWATAVQEDNR